jgi:endonuclease/exonuclease/phosphatase family metal-dependent hydrolase
MTRRHGRRTHRAALPCVAVALATTAVLTAFAGDAHAEPAGPRFSVLDWNIAGATTHDGDATAPDNFGRNAVADRMADLAATWRPAVISVNEACDSQVSRLRGALAARGLPVQAWTFTPTGNPHPACLLNGGTYAGVAVLSTVPGTSSASLWFDPGTNQVVTARTSRGVACLTVHLGRDVRACSMHLAQDQDAAVAQATAFATTYGAQLRTEPWLLLGDLNATPDRLGVLYDDLWETDMDAPNRGSATLGSRKIDYVFGSANAFDRDALGTAVLDPGTCRLTNVVQPPPFVKYPHPCSDHRPIVGSLTLL